MILRDPGRVAGIENSSLTSRNSGSALGRPDEHYSHNPVLSQSVREFSQFSQPTRRKKSDEETVAALHRISI